MLISGPLWKDRRLPASYLNLVGVVPFSSHATEAFASARNGVARAFTALQKLASWDRHFDLRFPAFQQVFCGQTGGTWVTLSFVSFLVVCLFLLASRSPSLCILFCSGESGAGKTESTKLILKFLSVISQQSLELSLKEKTSCVEQAILESRYVGIMFLLSDK